MKGFGIHDTAGNEVRVIDFIPGANLVRYVADRPGSHEAFFHEQAPALLWRLHPNALCRYFLIDKQPTGGLALPLDLAQGSAACLMLIGSKSGFVPESSYSLNSMRLSNWMYPLTFFTTL
jgi:hypothetical protein